MKVINELIKEHKSYGMQLDDIVQKSITHINATDYLKFDETNEYTALKELFALSNCVIDFPNDLTVVTDTPVILIGKNVTINGNGSVIKLKDNCNILKRISINQIQNYSGVCALVTCGNTNQVINNLIIDGNMRNNYYTDSTNQKWYTSFPDGGTGFQCSELSATHGIGMNGINICSDNVTIKNSKVHNCSWAGIVTTIHDVNFNNYLSKKWKDINIINCKLYQCVEDGISIVNAERVDVSTNNIINSYHHGIHIYTNYKDVNVKDNIVEISQLSDDIKVTPSFDINVVRQGIMISREKMKGYTQKNVIIENNKIINMTSKNQNTVSSYGSDSIGIWIVEFGYTEDYIVRNNYVYGFKIGLRLSAYDYGKNIIENNTFYNCTYPTLAIYGNNGFYNGLQNDKTAIVSILEFYNNKAINDMNNADNAFKWINYTDISDLSLDFKLIIKDFTYYNSANPIFNNAKNGIYVTQINNRNTKVVFTGSFENTSTSDSVVLRQGNLVTYNIKCKNKNNINVSGNQDLCYCANPTNDTCFPIMYINPDSSMGVVQGRVNGGKITYSAPSGTVSTSGEVILICNITYETN